MACCGSPLEPEKIERLLRVLEHRKGHELLAGVETAKIALSSNDVTTFDFDKSVADISLNIARANSRPLLPTASRAFALASRACYGWPV